MLLKRGVSIHPKETFKVHRTVTIVTCMCRYGNNHMNLRDLAKGWWWWFSTFLAFHCNHIKLNSPKKSWGRRELMSMIFFFFLTNV